MYQNKNNHLKVELWVVSETLCVGLRKRSQGKQVQKSTLPFEMKLECAEEERGSHLRMAAHQPHIRTAQS